MNSLHNVRTGSISAALVLLLAACGPNAAVVGSGVKADAAAANPDAALSDADAALGDNAASGMDDAGLSDGKTPGTDKDGSAPTNDLNGDASGQPDPDGSTADGGAPGGDVSAASNSCKGHCGPPGSNTKAPGGTCYCSAGCESKGACCSDYLTVCGASPPTKCGDGICQPPETAATCQADCSSPPPVACLIETCLWTLPCLGNVECSGALACIAVCKDEPCTQDCVAKVKAPLALKYLDLLRNECPGVGFCGEMIPEIPQICGDNACIKDEYATCPQDCGMCKPTCDVAAGESWGTGCPACGTVALTPGELCAQAKCEKFWNNCTEAPCRREFACMEEFDSLDACVSDQFQIVNPQLLTCAKQKGCLQTPDTWSCAGKCGQFETGQPCKCHPDCMILGNCCADIASACPAIGQKTCGNGFCEPAKGESAATCPADCSAGKPCSNKAGCGGGEVCCGVVGAGMCTAAAACK